MSALNTSLATGLWRISTNQSFGLECPYQSVSCAGGFGSSSYGNDICVVGYTGYLCGQCVESSQFLNYISWQCSECSIMDLIGKVVLILPVLLIIPYVLIKLLGKRVSLNLHMLSSADFSKIEPNYVLELFYERHLFSYVNSIKLLLQSLQVSYIDVNFSLCSLCY